MTADAAMTLEIAIDTLADAIAAVDAGADRLEVCDRLDQGGLTPPAGLVRALAMRTKVPLFVMIRPRAGDFVYSREEFAAMERQMEEAGEAGAHGFVVGLLASEGMMDLERTRQLVGRAGALPVTVHRAFDRCADLFATADELAQIGVRRILTSGGRSSAEDGAEVLRDLQLKMGQRIGILPGGGVRPSNIRSLLDRIGAGEIHSAARNMQGAFDADIVREMLQKMGRGSPLP